MSNLIEEAKIWLRYDAASRESVIRRYQEKVIQQAEEIEKLNRRIDRLQNERS